jgi:putative endonuclease
MWNVYIVLYKDGSFYTGIATDIIERIKRHNSGKGAKYTRSRRPVELLYAEEFDTKTEAIKKEIEIKGLSRENKKRLIRLGLGQRFSLVAQESRGLLGINSA